MAPDAKNIAAIPQTFIKSSRSRPFFAPRLGAMKDTIIATKMAMTNPSTPNEKCGFDGFAIIGVCNLSGYDFAA